MLEAAELGSQADSVSAKSERTGASGGAAEDGGRASSWASSFERLLEDPAGLHTFAVRTGGQSGGVGERSNGSDAVLSGMVTWRAGRPVSTGASSFVI